MGATLQPACGEAANKSGRPWQRWLYFKETICSHQPADQPLWQSVASHKLGAGRDSPDGTASAGQTPKPPEVPAPHCPEGIFYL